MWKRENRIEEGSSGCSSDFTGLDAVLATITKAIKDGGGLTNKMTPGTKSRTVVTGRD